MHTIFEIMDSEKSAGERGAAWSVGKLIELIDEAIDTAGAQLARSAGLWADSSNPFDERERQRASSARAQLEASDGDGGISPL